jgi:hypothetical protein
LLYFVDSNFGCLAVHTSIDSIPFVVVIYVRAPLQVDNYKQALPKILIEIVLTK